MKNLLAVATLLLAAAAACGDDGGSNNPKPDAAMITPDMAIDAPSRVCGTGTGGTLELTDFSAENGFALWSGPMTGTIGGGADLVYQFEFYGEIEPSLAGTFDLTAGNQSNYSTCAICVRAFALDANGEVT
jgi:hypothetical protein